MAPMFMPNKRTKYVTMAKFVGCTVAYEAAILKAGKLPHELVLINHPLSIPENNFNAVSMATLFEGIAPHRRIPSMREMPLTDIDLVGLQGFAQTQPVRCHLSPRDEFRVDSRWLETWTRGRTSPESWMGGSRGTASTA